MYNSVTIYSRNNCGYCISAKKILTENEIPYKEIIVNENDHCTTEDLYEKSGIKTYPQIFSGHTFIGGFTRLAVLSKIENLKEIFGFSSSKSNLSSVENF